MKDMKKLPKRLAFKLDAQNIAEDLVENLGSLVNSFPDEGLRLSLCNRGDKWSLKIADVYGHVHFFTAERKNGRKNGKWQLQTAKSKKKSK
jgi:hypothetical protein